MRAVDRRCTRGAVPSPPQSAEGESVADHHILPAGKRRATLRAMGVPVDDEDPVPGGSLTRSPEDRLQTLQTHGIFPSPAAVQELWSHVGRRRYPAAWEGRPLEKIGYAVCWGTPRKALCGGHRCGRSLGEYRPYRALDEYGIVENTLRNRDRFSDAVLASGEWQPLQRPWAWLDGEARGCAANTTAKFWCSGCKEYRARNLYKLGRRLFEDDTATSFLV